MHLQLHGLETCSTALDVERVIVVDDGLNEVRAGTFIAQALNHGATTVSRSGHSLTV